MKFISKMYPNMDYNGIRFRDGFYETDDKKEQEMLKKGGFKTLIERKPAPKKTAPRKKQPKKEAPQKETKVEEK